jgi:tetratricopeptide (TPR) repeat protein
VHSANVATTLMSLGRLRAAREEFERALAQPPIADEQCAYIHLHLGRLLERLGEPEGAEEEYRFALEHDERLAEAHLRLGLIDLDRGRSATALEHLDSALAGGAATAESVLQLALIAEEQGHADLADECAELLARASEFDPRAAFRYARFMLRSRDPRWHDRSTAITILRDLLEGPLSENGATWSLLGEALALEGDYRGALEAAERALAHEDETSPARRRIEAMRSWYLTILAGR